MWNIVGLNPIPEQTPRLPVEVPGTSRPPGDALDMRNQHQRQRRSSFHDTAEISTSS